MSNYEDNSLRKRNAAEQTKPNQTYIQVSSVLSAGGTTLGKMGLRQSVRLHTVKDS